MLLNERYWLCRGTGIVVLIGDEWKLAHYSLTFLIDNDAVPDAL